MDRLVLMVALYVAVTLEQPGHSAADMIVAAPMVVVQEAEEVVHTPVERTVAAARAVVGLVADIGTD